MVTLSIPDLEDPGTSSYDRLLGVRRQDRR